MTEKAFVFGPGLVGILSTPEGKGKLTQGPALILWNVGMNHRVGPYRFFVDLARRYSNKSGTSLRFDVSGLGDSELQAGRGNDVERAILDVQEAMKLVEQRTGIKQFVLVGFCSGVDVAHPLTVQDPRVVGLIQVEAYSYRSLRFYLNSYRKIVNRYYWRRYAANSRHRINALAEFLNLKSKGDTGGISEREAVFAREYPTPQKFRDDITMLVRRGVSQLYIYAGGSTEYRYAGQFHDMYTNEETRPKVDVIFYENADHTFSRIPARELAIQDIIGWIESRLGGQT
jgi:hypothetical protein